MATPDDRNLEGRLAVVERELARLREEVTLSRTDAEAARTLAAGADRDVSEVRAELRAHTQALNALRETQLDQHREMRAGFDRVDARIDRVDAQIQSVDAEMRQGFATMNAGMARITELLEGLAGS
ncbi:MAG TPA: hypothetical protein VF444_23080 [Pseudonocardiaceae bacterium]